MQSSAIAVVRAETWQCEVVQREEYDDSENVMDYHREARGGELSLSGNGS